MRQTVVPRKRRMVGRRMLRTSIQSARCTSAPDAAAFHPPTAHAPAHPSPASPCPASAPTISPASASRAPGRRAPTARSSIRSAIACTRGVRSRSSAPTRDRAPFDDDDRRSSVASGIGDGSATPRRTTAAEIAGRRGSRPPARRTAIRSVPPGSLCRPRRPATRPRRSAWEGPLADLEQDISRLVCPDANSTSVRTRPGS